MKSVRPDAACWACLKQVFCAVPQTCMYVYIYIYIYIYSGFSLIHEVRIDSGLKLHADRRV